ncbi:MAG: peptidoglycan-associated lipoprotein Pal [Telluria sp.]
MRHFQKVALIASAVLLTACSSTKLAETPVVEKTPTPAPVAQPDERVIRPVETGSVDPLNDPQGVLANRSVYFDYDSFVVREDGKPVVSNHSGYLTKNNGRKVLIQGNTDERGGTEYNLALGQKRAEAVRRSMAALGVSDSQMEAVSLGEEKPKATGSDEAAWAENRRADIVYQ